MRMTTKHLLYVVLLAAGLTVNTADASLLIGTSVTGTLNFGSATNYFDSANGFVPATGYLNTSSTTVPISQPQIEFGYQDGANQDSANFTDSQLYIEDQYFGTIGDLPFTMSFTDPAFAGITLTPTISNFPNALSASIAGTTITVTGPAQSFPANTSYIAVYNISSSPTPEPATGAVGLGLLSLCTLRRRKQIAV